MSLASGILWIVGVWIVLALILDGEPGAEDGDSKRVKLLEMCNARGRRLSSGDNELDMLNESNGGY